MMSNTITTASVAWMPSWALPLAPKISLAGARTATREPTVRLTSASRKTFWTCEDRLTTCGCLSV